MSQQWETNTPTKTDLDTPREVISRPLHLVPCSESRHVPQVLCWRRLSTKLQFFPPDRKTPSPCRTNNFHSCPWGGGGVLIPVPSSQFEVAVSECFLSTREDQGGWGQRACHAQESITHSGKGRAHSALLSAALVLTKPLSCYQPREQGQGQGSSDGAAAPVRPPHLP